MDGPDDVRNMEGFGIESDFTKVKKAFDRVYNKFGFVDVPKVHQVFWNCYSCVPFPTMIRSL